MLRLIVICVIALLSGAIVFVLIWAPQLPILLREGFPKPLWPAPGRFVEIAGAARTEKLPRAPHLADPGPILERLFEESGGRALLVLHGGVTVVEHYADGFSPETRFNSYSVAKGMVGALALKAVAEGRLEHLDVPIGDLLPGLDPSLAVATVRDLLEMRSEILFEGAFAKKNGDGRGDPFGPLARLHVFGLESVKTGLRGTGGRGDFLYQNINTALLGAALERLYGSPLAVLLSERIWKPAGARTAFWRTYGRSESVSPYCCLYATARDWARVGLFLTRNGTDGAPFLPEKLRRAFLGLDLDAAAIARGAYGLHVRHDVLNRSGEPIQGRFTYLHGQGGQALYFMPDQDLVVVRFGARGQLLHSTLYESWRAVLSVKETAQGG